MIKIEIRAKRFSSGKCVIFENRKIEYLYDAVNESYDQACRDIQNNEVFAIHRNLGKSHGYGYTIYTHEKSISLVAEASGYLVFDGEKEIGELRYGKASSLLFLGIEAIRINGWGKLFADIEFENNEYYYVALGLLILYYFNSVD